jgi:integrase
MNNSEEDMTPLWAKKEFQNRPDYPASSCTLRKGKYYVSVTVPHEIEKLFKSKQIRRSTGTSDKSLAKQKQHSLTTDIYRYMDSVYEAALKEWELATQDEWNGHAIRFSQELGLREGIDVERHQKYLEEEMHSVLRDHFGKGTKELDFEVTTALSLLTSPKATPSRVNKGKGNGQDSIGSTLETYLDGRNWTREKSKDTARRQIKRFLDMVGDIELAEIEKSHAYDYAQAMQDNGYAHKTIRSSVSAVAAMLDWCERKSLLKLSPFVNLKLSSYGTAPKKYLPFDKQELHQLFKQNMYGQERLLLSILITTGMRLDEVALLTWERVKEVDGIKLFSLIESGSEEVIVKNSQSNRLVALPDCLILPKRGKGRLFDYKVDVDGKAENAASRALMKVVRHVTIDKLKVVHSLRGTLKDLLRDVGISKEINDFITGHSQVGSGGEYGNGPSLETKYKAVNSVCHPWLTPTL